MTEAERLLAAQSMGAVTFGTLAQANASLAYDPWTTAWVLNDPVIANNGWYTKTGASGAGGWVRLGDLPYCYIRATNAGAGSANAIVATTTMPIPVADGGALISLNITSSNTATPVTVSFNGAPPLTIKTNAGNNPVIGGLVAGTVLAGYKAGAEFRLLSDQASAAILSAIEAVELRVQAYAAMLSADKVKFPTVAALKADVAMSYSSGPGLIQVGDGDIIEAGGFRYEVAASGATDHHVETAGGVKLYEAGPVFSATARMARQAGSADEPFSVLADPLRHGDFFWTDSDCSALVSRDSERGLVVAPADEPTGQFGAYVRKFYGTPSLDWFGVVDNGFDQSSKIHHAFDAIGTGEIHASPGVFLCNILIPNSIHLRGAGRRKTSFHAANAGDPIIEMGGSGGFNPHYIGLSGCEIDGKSTAAKGLYIGRTAAGRTVTYGELSNVVVRDCIDNIDANNVVGLDAWGVYSFGAANRGLHLGTSAMGTAIKFRRSSFRQNEIGVSARGSGALVDFDNCVIESNRDMGLYFDRLSTTGARQMTLRDTWFENNGHTPSTAVTSSIFIDMISTGVTNNWPSYLAFENCVISSPSSIRDVYLSRASEVEFRRCSFTALTSARLHAATSTGYAYATLRDCGTITERPSPTLYASFPSLVTSGSKKLGFKYEYLFEGQRYTNIEDA